jgi:hypothetical protein
MKFTSLTLLAGALALAFTPAASAADIVDTDIAGNFQTLVTAVKAALRTTYLNDHPQRT